MNSPAEASLRKTICGISGRLGRVADPRRSSARRPDVDDSGLRRVRNLPSDGPD